MRLVLLGAPGSGKGTQGALLAGHLGVPYMSSGGLLRGLIAAGTELGHQVEEYLDRGDLVPDELVLAGLGDALAEAHTHAGGYVLDGFPRTREQAQRLDALARPDVAVFLSLPEEIARQRIARRTDSDRSDDADRAVVDRRLRVFHDETEPLLDVLPRARDPENG